jgi:hypothetical protein
MKMQNNKEQKLTLVSFEKRFYCIDKKHTLIGYTYIDVSYLVVDLNSPCLDVGILGLTNRGDLFSCFMEDYQDFLENYSTKKISIKTAKNSFRSKKNALKSRN